MTPPKESSSRRSLALVSRTGMTGGGASMVACQLARMLKATDAFDVDHWTAEASPEPPRRSLRTGPLGDLVYRGSRWSSRLLGFPDFGTVITNGPHAHGQHYDICHVHDISGAISPRALWNWAGHSPLIWTFHDLSPLTGGCIYPLDCPTYLKGCGRCPQLGRWPLVTSIDRTSMMARYKLRLINEHIAAIVCPSRWMASEARKAGIREDLLHVIHNSVDTELFCPIDRRMGRRKLGLPENETMVLLTSVNFTNPYKGMWQGLQAIGGQTPGFSVLLIGGADVTVNLPEGPNYIRRPFTSDRQLLATYYAASDILLFPSIAENCSLALLECMACGTPPIVFDVGGNAEIVKHRDNGWVAKACRWEDLARGLGMALASAEVRELWGRRARDTIAETFSEPSFLGAHMALYRQVLAGSLATNAPETLG